jgi:hypothetical protein
MTRVDLLARLDRPRKSGSEYSTRCKTHRAQQSSWLVCALAFH